MSKRKRKSPPPLAYDIKFMGCKDGHLHCILVDIEDNEIGEFVLENASQAADFCEQLAKVAVDAFEEKIVGGMMQ